MDKRIIIAFVVVNYNTVDLLQRCLAAIARHAPMPHITVVVDNASTDGSAAMVRASFPQATLIANEANVGFPRAVNQGLAAAPTADYYFVLNSDVFLTPATLPPLLAHMANHPRTGIAAPAQQLPTGTRLLTIHRDPSLWRELARNLLFADVWRYRLQGEALARQTTIPVAVDWVMGAALFVRAEMVTDVGGMDEAVFMYGEEFDWAYRARLAGWQVYYVPGAIVIHHKSASADKAFSLRRYSLVTRSNYYFFAKHLGLGRLPLFVLFQLLGSWLRMAIAAPLCLVGRRSFCAQWYEHLYTLCTALNPRLYIWLLRKLYTHGNRA